MFEHRTKPLLPAPQFALRFLRTSGIAALVVLGSLAVGVVGYHVTERMSWVDSLFNASMILFGEGPATPLQTTAGKLFASGYAMFSGVMFLTVTAVLFGPLAHRMIHRFHISLESQGQDKNSQNEASPPQAGAKE